MTSPLETYLVEMWEAHSTGSTVDETSYYGALEKLLSAVGAGLKPRVRCVLSLASSGSGIPDGGLFTSDQFQKAHAGDPLSGQLPSRGAVEAKPLDADLDEITRTEQLRRYCGAYGQVLLTNYRSFALLVPDDAGEPRVTESYSLSGSAPEFWTAAVHCRRTAAAHAAPLTEFLQRVLLRPVQVSTPRDLAWFLASYARDARARIETADLPALGSIRAALEESLGVRFEGARGEHFFRSTLVQTLFYGLFSAWVLWARQRPAPRQTEPFDWRLAAHFLRVPVLQKLFHEITYPAQLDALRLTEVLNWAGGTLCRVDRGAFMARFEEEQAVQYFYEPFLEAYDPELRKELGVWYTPPEIVRYMVERVDTVLREELGIEAGLADPDVYVLDPCCGTGAYLVETLRRIERTLRESGADALLGNDLRKAATERVFGFELMPAPFVVAHLQVGLHLQKLGAPLSDRTGDRAAVYLTNALTGWEPPESPKQKFLFPELEAEREGADRVKHHPKILVVMGNPPYNGFAGMAVSEERVLTDAYRTAKRAPAPQGQGLNDLYVRFFRMAERRIVEHTGRGVVCFISNYSWLDGLSHTGMREHLLEAFDRIWIDCLNGDKYKTGKLTPDGRPDPSIFSTDANPEGIQVGTAVALMVRKVGHEAAQTVCFRHLWGKSKRAQLLDTAGQERKSLYEELLPPLEIGLPLMPAAVDSSYPAWPSLPDLFPVSFPGVKTSRDGLLVDIDQERLIQRMELYFDPAVSDDEISRLVPSAMESTAAFDARAIRRRLCARGFLRQNVVRYCYRPFDARWLYWEPETRLLDRNRSDYFPHVRAGNVWLEARQRQPKELFDRGYVTTVLADNFGNGLSSFFPLRLHLGHATPLLSVGDGPMENASSLGRAYLCQIDADYESLFYHLVATLHSPAYREDNAGALRQDWPRAPLPATGEDLLASAELGRRVAALLDVEQAVPGVTAGSIRKELRALGAIQRSPDLLDPELDLRVTAGWGHAGQGGITMPGQGKLVRRDYIAGEAAALEEGAGALGIPLADLVARLGETTLDVYLNECACWVNVPARVWSYTLGGYQAIKKWLSYRELDLLGRPLKPEEARHVTAMVRRIAALLLLEPDLDANYSRVKSSPFPWMP